MSKEISTVYESSLLCEKYVKYCHQSGLTIYVFPKKFTATYAVFGVRYGSIDTCFCEKGTSKQKSYPDGIAHFLEHKLFANSDGSDSLERFSKLGADANAYTDFNRTAYLFNCTDNFEDSLAELLDFVTHPYFTDDSVASEMGIISEELKMYEDDPSDRCFCGMLEGLYRHHNIRKNIGGTVRSISKITSDMLYECYDAFYRLQNMVLAVCGDVDAEKVIEIADKHLPKECRAMCAESINGNLGEAPNAFKNYSERKMQVSKPLFYIGFKDTDIPSDPLERQKKDAAMSILDEMLFSAAGELYSQLLEKELISPGFSYGYTISKTAAYNSLDGESKDPKAVLEEIMSYLDTKRKEGLSKEDFIRGKRIMYSEFVKSFDSVESICNDLFLSFCEDTELLSYSEILNSVEFEDVENLFSSVFNPKYVTLSVINPIEQINDSEKTEDVL